MPDTYEVVKIKYAGEKPNPHKPGQSFYKFYLSLKDSAGQRTDDVYWQRLSNILNDGELHYGHIEDGEYGPRFKTDQRPTGASPGASNGSGGPSGQDTPGPEFWAQKDRRIARAGIVQAVVSGKPPPKAQDGSLLHWLDEVDEVADALLARLDQRTPHPSDTGSADGGGGINHSSATASPDESPSRGPSAAVSTSKQPVSQPQKDFLSSLLKDAGADSEAQQVVISYAESELSGERDGPISRAIDGLKGDNRAEWLVRIVSAAEKWSAEQPNVPAPDVADLPELAGVGGDDDSIPF